MNLNNINNVLPPNIFNWATSELSQDAFLAYIFKWAEGKYSKINKLLNEASITLIKTIFNEKRISINEPISLIEIYKQHEKIDLWIVINNKYNLIIEDKVKTKEHNNQLQRTKEIVEYWCKSYKQKFIMVYYKSGKLTNIEKKKCDENNFFYKINEENLNQYFIKKFFDKVDDPIIKGYLNYYCQDENGFDKQVSNTSEEIQFYNFLVSKISNSGVDFSENLKPYFWIVIADFNNYDQVYLKLTKKLKKLNVELYLRSTKGNIGEKKFEEYKKKLNNHPEYKKGEFKLSKDNLRLCKINQKTSSIEDIKVLKKQITNIYNI